MKIYTKLHEVIDGVQFFDTIILYREKGTVPLEHYFTNNDNLKSEIRELSYIYNGKPFIFLSDNGVFAKNKIDYASRLLVESFLKLVNTREKNCNLLDVGCGYGYMGIVIGGVLGCCIDLVDVNKRAVHLSERNIKLNNVKGRAFISNAYESVKNKYKYIITNPPIRAGKDVVLDILANAKGHLEDGGELWFVINKDQGAKSIKKIMDECYKVEVVAKSKGFFVFCAKID